MKLPAGAHVEFGEDLAQMPLDGARADEELLPDLGIRTAISRESRDVDFLGRQFVKRVGSPLAHRFTSRCELMARPLGEGVDPHVDEHLMRGSKMCARVNPAILPPQPFAVQQVCARKFRTDLRSRQPIDPFAVALLGGGAPTYERLRPGLDPERPVASARNDRFSQSRQRIRRYLVLATTRRGLDEF